MPRKNTPRTFDALELSVERGLQQHQCDEGKVTTGSDCSDKKVYNLFQQLSNTDQEKYWPSMRGVQNNTEVKFDQGQPTTAVKTLTCPIVYLFEKQV